MSDTPIELTPVIVELSKLELGPNDHLVIRMPVTTSLEDLNSVHKGLCQHLGHGRVLVLTKDNDLGVVKQSSIILPGALT